MDPVEAGRRLGHDLHALSHLPLQHAWPAAVREGFALAQARAGRRQQPDRFTRKWLQLRLGALARGRVVADDVTPATLAQLDCSHCPVTREPLSVATGGLSDGSIDRLNNAGGYALGNLALMSTRANRAKSALDVDGVLQRARAAHPVGGLAPVAWLRLAALMLGPAFAERGAEAPDLPLCVPLPASTLRTATQQIQRLLTLSAGKAAERNRVLRALAPGGVQDASARQLNLLAERLHHALKRLPPQAECWDAWLAPEMMPCLHAWKASLSPQAWAALAQRAGLLAGGQAVTARSLVPWQLPRQGYFAGPPMGQALRH